jgi:hypothetical protein
MINTIKQFKKISKIQFLAQNAFYEWEKKLFPRGITPLSDDDRIIWCEGFITAIKSQKYSINRTG